MKRRLVKTAVPAVLVAVWQLLFEAGAVNPQFLPPPTAVATRFWSLLLSGALLRDSISSFQRVGLGLGLGVTTGVGLGLVMGYWRRVDDLLTVTVQVLRAIPPITWIGFAMLWFGLGTPPGVFLISLGVVFPMLINAYAGVRQVDLIYVRAARNVGASGWMLFTNVILMAALPSVLTGLRVSVALAWILVVVGELIAVPAGLGYSLIEAQEWGQPDRMVIYMLTIGFYGYLFDLAVVRLTAYLLRWQRSLASAG